MATRPRKTDEERVKDIDIRESVTLLTKTLLNYQKKDVKNMTPRERSELLKALLPYNIDKSGEVDLSVKVSMTDLLRKYAEVSAIANE